MKPLSVIPKLMLDTKALIPFPAAQVNIYQPSLQDIAMMGGDSVLLIGIEALTKNYVKTEGNFDSSLLSNFEIFMKVIQDKTQKASLIREAVEKILFLIFPNYRVGFTPISIILQEEENENKNIHMIDKNNFDEFTTLLKEIFVLAEFGGSVGKDYNPLGDRARAIVEKFKKRDQILAELRRQQGEDDNISVFGRYMNILAVGEHKDKNALSQYSVYQITEEFKRFQLERSFDYTFQAKMAGATKLKDAKDWMVNIQFGADDNEEN